MPRPKRAVAGQPPHPCLPPFPRQGAPASAAICQPPPCKLAVPLGRLEPHAPPAHPPGHDVVRRPRGAAGALSAALGDPFPALPAPGMPLGTTGAGRAVRLGPRQAGHRQDAGGPTTGAGRAVRRRTRGPPPRHPAEALPGGWGRARPASTPWARPFLQVDPAGPARGLSRVRRLGMRVGRAAPFGRPDIYPSPEARGRMTPARRTPPVRGAPAGGGRPGPGARKGSSAALAAARWGGRRRWTGEAGDPQ